MIRPTSWFDVTATLTQALAHELHLLAEALRNVRGGR